MLLLHNPWRHVGFNEQRQQQQQQMQLGAQSSTSPNAITKTLAAILTAGWLLVSSPLPSLADGSRVIGELQGSGLVFKVSLVRVEY